MRRKINFRGPIFDQAELEQTFRAARIFVYPSLAERGESFGLAPLEAMAHGCAVLVSDLACFHDFIRDHETGFIFNHRALDAAGSLRQKLEGAMADPSLLSQIAEAGYRKSAEYSLADVADQFSRRFQFAASQLPMAQEQIVNPEQTSAYESPWSGSQRVLRVLWEFCWIVFCAWTPKPLNEWRLFWLRVFDAKIDGKPFVHQRARIAIPWNLTLHDRACLGRSRQCLQPGRN